MTFSDDVNLEEFVMAKVSASAHGGAAFSAPRLLSATPSYCFSPAHNRSRHGVLAYDILKGAHIQSTGVMPQVHEGPGLS